MSLVSCEFHKKKRVVENGKEQDIIFSPKRFPSTATRVNFMIELDRINSKNNKPTPNPPSYWAAGSPAAAAKRTREVCDELYWAAVESGEDALIAATAIVSSNNRHGFYNTTTPSMVRGSTSNSISYKEDHQQQFHSGGGGSTTIRPQSAVTIRSQQSSVGSSSSSSLAFQQQQQSNLLGHVSETTTLPLSGGLVSADLRNSASNMVKLALRGRSQWEHAQKKKLIMTSVPRASSMNMQRPASAYSNNITAKSLSRPRTATTSDGHQQQQNQHQQPQRPLSATSAAMIDQFRKRGSSPTGFLSSATRPNSASSPSAASSSPSSVTLLGNGTVLYQNNSDGLFTTTPFKNRWEEFEKSFNGPQIASREIAEFERRCAQNKKFKEMLENMKKQQQERKMQFQQNR